MSNLDLYRQYSLVLNGINDQMVKYNTELSDIIFKAYLASSTNEIPLEIENDPRARDLMQALLILRPTLEYFQQQKMLYYNRLDKKE